MNNFIFDISVSTTYYTGKCPDWGKLRYQTIQVDVDSLADYIQSGYCFTHTFAQVSSDGTFGCKEKTIANFKATNSVFLDVDRSYLTAYEFFTTVSPQPTILYTTPSNVTGVENRFRLIYLYKDKILSNEEYKHEVQKISTCIGNSIPNFSFDATSVNASQQMGGNRKDDCQLYKSNTIFSLDTFNAWDCIPNPYKKEKRNDISNRNAVIYKEEEVVVTDKEFMDDFWKIDDDVGVDALLSKYRDRYPLLDATAVDADIPYIALDDNYVEIARRYYVVKDEGGNNRALPVKIKEGQREKTLFCNALLRLKIQPLMTFEHLLFALICERQYWIDNSDGEFGNHKLYKIAKGAFCKRALYDISSATNGQKRKRSKTNKNGYKVNKAFCEKHGVGVRRMANYIRSSLSTTTLLQHYDFEKSVKENSILLKEKGIKPNSERRLYQFKKWCKENNIKNNLEHEEI